MKNLICLKFNSVGEMSQHLSDAKVQPYFAEAERFKSGSFEEGSSFSKTKSFDEANDLLLYGDKELAKKIEDAGVGNVRLKLKSQTNRRQVYSSVVGFAPNVPNFIAGTPNSMINIRQVKTKQRVITVAYNTSVSCFVTPDEIVRAAAKFVSAVMLIEASGVRVNVFSVEVFRDRKNRHRCCFMTRIKDSGQKIDTLRMSYPIAHPSMLRRHWFRLLETTPGIPESYVRGYGRPIKEEKECMKVMNDAGIHNINRCLSYYDVESLSVEQIVNKLTEER